MGEVVFISLSCTRGLCEDKREAKVPRNEEQQSRLGDRKKARGRDCSSTCILVRSTQFQTFTVVAFSSTSSWFQSFNQWHSIFSARLVHEQVQTGSSRETVVSVHKQCTNTKDESLLQLSRSSSSLSPISCLQRSQLIKA